ncbi:betaine/proline/choline family ABC transporter ATP-binding protein [Vagococcus acidifermentans]|uniref:Quaternary amine transport ATP-binding protein n=1 Tax=Vagococcus acidifermentans TaxID=564710 RepID=A0A430ARI2_9ENTE|nr:ABC transporter ATP-binding protein [Vagococcus acidifermentans]RSU10670.1 glycine/betaine ABC transporter ATP-binding protein [Vagococcus acidifermentans]
MIKMEHVSMAYGEHKVIDDFNLEIEAGQLVVIIGPSGCGKTTILQLINRLINPTEGRILLNDVDIQDIDPVELRRGIGYVIQEIGLFPHMTIEQNIEIVPKMLKWPVEKRKARTLELLKMVDMDAETYLNRYPANLSGGQQQRIGVLRALAAEPPLILMDEPFGALDPITRDNLQSDIKKLQKKLKKTIVFVTHDIDEAIKIADVIVLLQDGKIIQADTPDELLSHPANEFVEQFVGKHRLHTGGVEKVKDVMRSKVFKVTLNTGLAQSIALMENEQVSSLLVVDDGNHLIGSLGIADIMEKAHPGMTVSDLELDQIPSIQPDAPAKEAFDIITEQNLDILAVVDGEMHILGVVTKTSMVKSLARVVWGGDTDV